MAKKIQLQTKTSIVDYLKSKGQDNSFESRKNLYEKYIGKGYTGTADQNTQLIKSVNVPAGIKRAASGNTDKLPMSSAEVPGTTPPAVKTTEKPAKKLTANEHIAQSVSSPFRYSSPEVPGTNPPSKEVVVPPVKTITAKKVAAPFKLSSPEPPHVKAPGLENTAKTTTAPITTLKGLDYARIAASAKPNEQGYVDLTHMGFDPLGKDGVRIAEEVSKKYPNARFLCTAGGCAEIATKGATALGYTFNKGNAWEIGNNNQVVYETPKMKAYEPQMGTGQPMSDPAGGKQDSYITGLSAGYIVGMNRANNNIPGTGFNKATALDSYDYANPDLYPNSRGYEHVGVTLGDKRILHGTGAVTGLHPSYYEISNLDKPFNLGLGDYETVEAIKGHGAYKQSGGKIKLCHQCGGTRRLPVFAHGELAQNGDLYNQYQQRQAAFSTLYPNSSSYPGSSSFNYNANINTPVNNASLDTIPQQSDDFYQRYQQNRQALHSVYPDLQFPDYDYGALAHNKFRAATAKPQGNKHNWVDYLHAGEGAIQYVGGLFNEAHDYRNEKRQLRQGLENIEEDVYDKDKYGLNPASFLMEYGGETPLMKKGGKNWIKKAVNPKHKGYCTPMTKSTCTPKRKALARTFKKHHGFHKAAQYGGYMNDMVQELLTRQVGGPGLNEDQQKRYGPWGPLAPTIMKEGWSTSSWPEYTEYYPGYEASGKGVLMDGQNPSGNVVVRAGNNGQFDIMVRDSKNKYPEHYVKRGLTAQQAHDYFVNQASTIAQRIDTAPRINLKMKTGGPTAAKAREMLRDGTAQGKALTKKQKRYFGFIAGGGHPRKQNAGLPEVYGAPDNNPEVWAETGEAARMQDGSIVRIAANGTYNYDHGESAKMPGTPINGAESFLEATSTKKGRTAMADRLLKVDRDTAEQLTGYRPKRPLSHATLLDQSTEHYGKLKKKMLKRLDLQLGRGLESEASRNSVMMNMDFIGNIPTTNQLYDSLFTHQEGVKQAHAIPDEPTSEQKSQYDVKYKYGGSRMAQNALNYVNNIVNQGNTVVGRSGKAKSVNRPARVRSVTRASGRNSGSLFGPEYTHLLQDHPEMFQLSPEAQQALPQLYDIPQSKRSSGFYGEKDWNMDDFKKRHGWYFNSRPDWNPSNPNDVKDFQTQYNRHARIYTGKDYFAGTREKGIDEKFGEYTYNAPGLNEPQIALTPRKSLTPGAPPTELNRTPNLQIGLPPYTSAGTTTPAIPTGNTTKTNTKNESPYFPLEYSDIASARNAYLNAMNRDPETMLNTYLPRVQYKTTDPTRALREVDLTSNAVMRNAPGGTQGMGFKSQIQANAIKQKSDIGSQYDNANTAILNRQEDVNMTNKGQEAQFRTQNTQNFIDHYMQSRATAGEQKQQALDSYYNSFNKNRMFNNMVEMMKPGHYALTTDEMGRPGFSFDGQWKVNAPVIDDSANQDLTNVKPQYSIVKDANGNTFVVDKTTQRSFPVQGLAGGTGSNKKKLRYKTG
jgi:hypothetical protein